MRKDNEFLRSLHSVPGFGDAVLRDIVVDRDARTATLDIVTDTSYTGDALERVRGLASCRIPSPLACRVEVKKVVTDRDAVRREVYRAVCERHKIIGSSLSEEDIAVEKNGDVFSFVVPVAGSAPSQGIVDEIVERLEKNFCGRFEGRCADVDFPADDACPEETGENVKYDIPPRTFRIEGFRALESAGEIEEAVYISDATYETDSVVICGNIKNIYEQSYETASGNTKSYFRILLDDTTGCAQVTCFPRQKSMDHIRALREGDGIVCTCKAELYKGALRFTVTSVDFGGTPEGFVPEKKQSLPVPRFYEHVRPEPYEDISQANFFSVSDVPEFLKENEFVVVDIETTGTNANPSDQMDRIIELGACRISRGEIRETFQTLINPGRRLPEEIIRLTHITDAMLEGKPGYEEVMPDFYKFSAGASLVGHNIAMFDFRFLDYYCSKTGYVLERRLYDTLLISNDVLPQLRNHKLDTIADYYGLRFDNQHHRALDDAIVTAKIFMEFVKVKKTLTSLG